MRIVREYCEKIWYTKELEINEELVDYVNDIISKKVKNEFKPLTIDNIIDFWKWDCLSSYYTKNKIAPARIDEKIEFKNGYTPYLSEYVEELINDCIWGQPSSDIIDSETDDWEDRIEK